MIRPYHVPVLFGVELGGQFRGIDEVTEHDGELTAFGFWRVWFEGWCTLRGLIVLGRRLFGWLSRGRGCFGNLGVTDPDQNSVILVNGKPSRLGEFFLQILDIVVIQAKLPLKRTIRCPALLLEERNDLGEHVVKVYDRLSPCPSGNARTASVGCAVHIEAASPGADSLASHGTRLS